ncbi:hypothetical protein CS266P2_00001 [Clostridium phage CS266P2]|jgi:hypothetical protein|nr:hypothetical protein CS266P1_00043 [Clostridium phage CS266P1]WAX12129.1 hypothetical protein CS266P2_00001 [Clostridium phage CS266P2]WAX12339.1 hypothetical protein CS266P4_00071 [Clostridium phage CS266P4]DAP48986.1 MAG TPA: hypothetical protein [Caudoviricetes sp.]DAZ33423.1 MAG TPA: hypothetical protein [Caudoviricetes sp.]
MSKQYGCLPSVILGIEDSYTAFCFNEACCEILARLQNDEKPYYIEQREQAEEPKHYSNFKDFYKAYGG